jgi:hypothetical protein
MGNNISAPPNTMNAQLNPYTRETCLENCKMPAYNSQLQCGVSSPVWGLLAQDPDKARCSVNINNLRNECIQNCQNINTQSMNDQLLRDMKLSNIQEINTHNINISVDPTKNNMIIQNINWTGSLEKIQDFKNLQFTAPINNNLDTIRINKIGPGQSIPTNSTPSMKIITYPVSGHWLHSVKNSWGYAIKWKTKRWGWHIYPTMLNIMCEGVQVEEYCKDPNLIMQDAINTFASCLGINPDEIATVIFPENGRGYGNITPINCRWRVVWDMYEFKIVLK